MASKLTLSKLRPAKVRSGIARRWFEWRIGRTPVSGRGQPVSFGSAYGGWMVPTALIEPGWICYCVGAGNDISFDLELIERFDVRVQSVEPVEQYVSEARESRRRRASLRDLPRGARHPRRVRYACSARTIPTGLALSSANLFDTEHFIEVPGRTLASLASELGHSHIDLLKFDIEGAEYEVVPQLDLDALGVKALAFQVHHNRGPREAQRLIEHLDERGFELIGMRPTLKLAFARRELLGA